MFTEEVGVSPLIGDGGAAYRARVAELIRAGRAFARIEDGRVIFKAEVGAATSQACQVQGVWVRPEFRGRGLAAPGMAAVVTEARRAIAPVVSLYVNDFNAPARAAYQRTGFRQVGEFMSVLFLAARRGAGLVAVADLAEAFQHRLVRLGQRGEVVGADLVDEVLPDAVHVGRGDPLYGGHAARGDHRERAALVAVAAFAADQVPGLHAGDLVGEPAAGLRGEIGEFGHAQAVPWCFGELDKDLVVVRGQPEGVQVPVKLAHKHLRQPDVSAPRALLGVGEPAGVTARLRRTVSHGLCRHTT